MVVAKNLNKECYIEDYLFNPVYNKLIAQYWYALGVYSADGNVQPSGLSIEVQQQDALWVESVASLVTQLTGIPKHCDFRQINNKTYIRYRHHSTLLSQYFVSLGIPFAKTHVLRFNPQMPSTYHFPFLLGYFDGNGWVCCRERSSRMELSCGISTGSKLFAYDIEGLLHQSSYPASLRKASNRNSYSIEWWGKKAENFLTDLYSKDLMSLCLLRKFLKLEKYKNRVVHHHSRWWSKQDEQFLWNHKEKLSYHEMATILHRSERAIRLKLLRLGKINNDL